MDDYSSDLAAWLAATADRYDVRQTLKESPYEVTEVVYRRAREGEAPLGPFVRKRFVEDVGRGKAYEQLLRAQTQGVRLEHQPIVYECERVGDSVDVVMEYLQGETLDMLVRHEPVGLDLAARVMPQLCDAVSELHESFDQPLIHRDIKPSNVMVCSGRVMLIDLGIARAYRSDATRDTVRFGTVGYAPPEQFGYGQTSTRSDVHALGMTLAFCLTGEDPTFELRQSGFDDPRIPPAMREVLMQATEFDPNHRYASARELKTHLELALTMSRTSPKSDASVSAPAIPQLDQAQVGRMAHAPLLQHPFFVILGRLWNIVLVAVWILMGIACVGNVIRPAETYAQWPRWMVFLLFYGMMFVPFTLWGYLLLDKRRLRKRWPFSKFTWRKEIPVCILGGLAIMVLSFAICFAIMRPS